MRCANGYGYEVTEFGVDVGLTGNVVADCSLRYLTKVSQAIGLELEARGKVLVRNISSCIWEHVSLRPVTLIRNVIPHANAPVVLWFEEAV